MKKRMIVLIFAMVLYMVWLKGTVEEPWQVPKVTFEDVISLHYITEESILIEDEAIIQDILRMIEYINPIYPLEEAVEGVRAHPIVPIYRILTSDYEIRIGDLRRGYAGFFIGVTHIATNEEKRMYCLPEQDIVQIDTRQNYSRLVRSFPKKMEQEGMF